MSEANEPLQAVGKLETNSEKAKRLSNECRDPLPRSKAHWLEGFGKGAAPSRLKQKIIFFMEFVDNVTPQSGRDYAVQFESIPIPRWFWNKRDEQTARDYMSLYYQNAYNTALLNYQNEYNSPLQQMLRYQEAGLNPFLAANDPGNMGSAPSGAAPRGSSAAGDSPAQVAGAFNQAVGQINQTLQTAKTIYDYLQYGRPLQELSLDTQGTNLDIKKVQKLIEDYNLESAQSSAATKNAEMQWSRYWNLGEDAFSDTGGKVSDSPRAKYMDMSTQRIASQIDQLQSLVKVLYPAQADNYKATKALNDLKREVLDGQKGAVLNLSTGDEKADSIMHLVAYWLLDR